MLALCRKFLVYTFGQCEYPKLADNGDSFFRLLLHTFTPADLVDEFIRFSPLPGTTPK